VNIVASCRVLVSRERQLVLLVILELPGGVLVRGLASSRHRVAVSLVSSLVSLLVSFLVSLLVSLLVCPFSTCYCSELPVDDSYCHHRWLD
jgi:hypothetical protein